MIQKRLEILKSNEWVQIELFFGEGLRYNNVINKMANTTDRSLSHSNTFEIPWTKQNIDALDLNTFNSSKLANALNKKYEAKYYVDNQLLQQGFVVINNMYNGTPSLNFIDEALSLTELWGATTYKEFLENDLLIGNLSSAYTDAVDAMKAYDMDKNAVLSVLSNISGETFPVAYFPNNVNTIGDKFQNNTEGARTLDHFNPYQSRPLFNAKAFLDMVTEAYGYSLIENTSIDWAEMAVTTISSNELAQGEKDEGSGTSEVIHDEVAVQSPHFIEFTGSPLDIFNSQVTMTFPASVGITPNDLPNFPTNPSGVLTPGSTWFSSRSIFVPDVSAGNVGTINFKADVENSGAGLGTNDVTYIIYEDTSVTDGYIFIEANVDTTNDTTTTLDWTMDKAQFDNATTINPDAGTLIGIYVLRYDGNSTASGRSMFNMVVTESILASDIVSFDDYGQYLQDTVDLRFAAPQKTILKIINGILQRFGALINIDHKAKEVEIFTYDHYTTARDNSNFVDWTDYLQEYASPNFNTNYGNSYAIKNVLGLGSPYLGNSVEHFLGNQVSNSKLKEFATNYNTEFNDITNLVVVNNTIPYDEFSIGGASMVEFDYNSTSLTQYRVDIANATIVTQGATVGVPFMRNVNFSVMPTGLSTWYTIVDESLRAKPLFLLPQIIIKNLDLKDPVYIGKLGGFFIIEEIEQYVDESTPVLVKLLKMTT